MQFDKLGRRSFIKLLSGAAAALPLATGAQQPGTVSVDNASFNFDKGNIAPGSDIPPIHTLYMGLEDGTIASDPMPKGWRWLTTIAAFDDSGLRISDQVRTDLITNHVFFDPRRGSVEFWVRLNAAHNANQLLKIYPGYPVVGVTLAHGAQGHLSFDLKFSIQVADTIQSDTFNFAVGEWHHFVWAWQGAKHWIYRDGKLVTEKISFSPLPATWNGTMYIGEHDDSVQDITIRRWGIYNFAMTRDDVAAAYNRNHPAPVTPSGQYGLDVAGIWGVGEAKLHLMVDAGCAYATRAVSCRVNVYRDHVFLLSDRLKTFANGWAEKLVDLGSPLSAPGSYNATVELLDKNDGVLASRALNGFVVQPNQWIGNSIGISDEVQAPWTAISANGSVLSVWGRDYTLTNGWGLPQQISSQGQNILAAPVSLTFDKGSGGFNLAKDSFSITSVTDHEALWTGHASAQGISATINGSLDYTGLVSVELTLAATGAPVSINSIVLKTSLPAARALYYFVVGDKPFWDQVHKREVPAVPGTFIDTTTIEHIRTLLYTSIVLSDEDRGLEWSADNLNGWRVADGNTEVIQSLVKEPDGSVSVNCNFATQTFRLDKPISIKFYYIATPVKPLPSDWRVTQLGDTVPPYSPTVTTAKWVWPDDQFRRNCWRAFSLEPENMNTYIRQVSALKNRPPLKLAPYTDQMILAHSGEDNTGTEMDMAYPESTSSENSYVPTRGMNDYVLYHFERVVAAGGAEAIYIDDPFSSGVMDAKLMGGGYVRDDLTHGVGFNFNGMADKMKRLSQMFIDHRITPLIWLHSTGTMTVRGWRFATHLSDGESFLFETTSGPDWIDVWYNPAGSGLQWLKCLGRTRKFGFASAFLDYIKFYSPVLDYLKAQRAMRAGLALMDINPISRGAPSDYRAFLEARLNFGLLDSHVFHGYWDQTAITTDHTNVKCSYYVATNKVLAYVANLGGTSYNGKVRFNKAALGLSGIVTAINAETSASISVTSNSIDLAINKHDYRAIQFNGQK